jgi:hypothetical protein
MPGRRRGGGLLEGSLATLRAEGRRQFGVVAQTKTTEALAQRMAARAREAGIEIALVDGQGNVRSVEWPC